MDRILEKLNIPRLTQKEIEIMDSPVISSKSKLWLKKKKSPQKNKSPGPDGFTGELYQTFRDKLSPILLKLFQKIAEEGTLPNSFYEATISLIPKPDKDNTQKRKLQANIANEHRCKNPQQNFSKQFNNTLKSSYTMIKLGLF